MAGSRRALQHLSALLRRGFPVTELSRVEAIGSKIQETVLRDCATTKVGTPWHREPRVVRLGTRSQARDS
jgi:hypothetical protein